MDKHVVVWAVSRWVFRDVIPSLARRERRLLTNDILHFELTSPKPSPLFDRLGQIRCSFTEKDAHIIFEKEQRVDILNEFLGP
jgi:hypothetical protein